MKRKILSAEKDHYEALLKGRSAFEARSELADALMEPHDKEPPTLPSANALRLIKHRSDAPKQNAVMALVDLKKEHPTSIGAIGLDPFFVHYSTELQRACYKVECSRKKPTISIDATGPGMNNDKIYVYVPYLKRFFFQRYAQPSKASQRRLIYFCMR